MTSNALLFLLVILSTIITASPLRYSQATWLPSRSHVLRGEWQLLRESVGISAMHMQLLHDDKVIIFDRTDFGLSNLSLPHGRCRMDPLDIVLPVDCTAHSVLYDIATNTFRPLMVQTDVWCSSAAITPDGTLVQTGGYNDGDRVVRTFTPCDDDRCDWIESPGYLSVRRWYATNQILPDGRIIIVGGRQQFNYEFYPSNLNDEDTAVPLGVHALQFLKDTWDSSENNLYPFLHLLPDGNLFIFSNNRSICFDYNKNTVVREFPPIPGGEPRNYPSSGSSVLLPLDENGGGVEPEAEVMVCGGASSKGYAKARRGRFLRAVSTCGRLKVTDKNPKWVVEKMPMARVMGDMLLLPNGEVIIINGAGLGTAGWEFGRKPIMQPILYRTESRRFSRMRASSRPRMYHSSAVLLSDGRILVGGNNPHMFYNFTGVKYPTDLSLEAYSPPYLSDKYTVVRPRIEGGAVKVLRYGQPFSVTFVVPSYASAGAVAVTVVAPSFTTHSLGMNQRLVKLKVTRVVRMDDNSYDVAAVGPSSQAVAPPGYYLLFVVHAGIPSSGTWVKLQISD